MTDITIDKLGRSYIIEAKYHAETSKVCAAVSALLCTLDCALRNNKHAKLTASMRGYGYYTIACERNGKTAREDWNVITMGLLQIEQAHPDEIKVTQNIFL